MVGLLLGWLGDRIRRTRAMFWSVLLYSIFSGLCAFVQGPWQLAAPAFLTFFIRIFVPESEKWESSHRKETVKVSVAELFQEGLVKYTLIGAGLATVALLGTWGSVQWIPSWVNKLTNKAPSVRETVQI